MSPKNPISRDNTMTTMTTMTDTQSVSLISIADQTPSTISTTDVTLAGPTELDIVMLLSKIHAQLLDPVELTPRCWAILHENLWDLYIGEEDK